jgi:hypothetical protein
MDMRALKVGQRVLLQHHSEVEEVTVTEVTEKHVQVEAIPSDAFTQWWESPSPRGNPPAYNSKHTNGFAVDFNYDGTAFRGWGVGPDASCPLNPEDGIIIVGLVAEATSEGELVPRRKEGTL